MDLKLSGKAAIVTGGGSGIGRAIAVRLGAEGALVAVTDLKKEGAEKVAAEIMKAGGTALALESDATREADVEGMVLRWS